ncbi:MAG: stage II sporulation protein P, partial [Clostridia bacterium]|nr:stage II sporulation protein P [Clostridia bacterium]
MRRIVALALLMMVLAALPARAENDGDCVYTLLDPSGSVLTMRAGRMFTGDEYIAADNREYRVVAVDDAAMTATAEYVSDSASEAFAAKTDAKADGNRLICMYSTHSDESYVPDDGTESKWQGAGIYDVGDSLKAALRKKGIEAVYSHETFLPHDADAYTRSRRTAEELLKQGPDALIDIHRDAVPAKQYETEVDGEDISKVRLFVGRSNPNAAANKQFARQIKAAADEAYPGLIKDIFIGRGNYNQELYANSILLEFGTHEIDKDKAIAATSYMADVLDSVLYGKGARARGQRGASTRSAAKGVGAVVLALAAAAVVFAFVATGSGRGTLRKLSRHVSEVTGGVLGKNEHGRGNRE